ncbi:hypothetical protein EVAR_88359_1 [Eumeta japonica]|uniref:Secreted protein n=1 Tax=Eumeta variegata TaxID=151549 RepID=A0A4C1XBP9_EUMVA|nr:hypothetical protein EVAR_88359_1 [Eumeta japonica]
MRPSSRGSLLSMALLLIKSNVEVLHHRAACEAGFHFRYAIIENGFREMRVDFVYPVYLVKCCARGRPIIVEWERDARHSAGLSLVRRSVGQVEHPRTSVRCAGARKCVGSTTFFLSANIREKVLQIISFDGVDFA